MKTILCFFIFFFVVAIVFRWAWNFFLRDFFIIMLPPRDDPRSDEMEGLFDAYDKAFTEKKRENTK